jgi:hypothetical protein
MIIRARRRMRGAGRIIWGPMRGMGIRGTTQIMETAMEGMGEGMVGGIMGDVE